MTFGRTLQELTRLCGVKRCNLADALGYDPSYISRWINGVKHPSLRSNDALPAQIAAYLTANAAPDVRARRATARGTGAPSPEAVTPSSARSSRAARSRRCASGISTASSARAALSAATTAT